MVIGELIKQGGILNTDSQYKEARLILSHVSGLDLTFITIHPEKEISADICAKYAELLDKRRNGMPLAYITGTKEFYGYFFQSESLGFDSEERHGSFNGVRRKIKSEEPD